MKFMGFSMAKSKKRVAVQANQASLFDILSHKIDVSTSIPREGSCCIHEKIRQAIIDALKNCTKSRWQIAGDMSHLLGTEISIHQLNAWAAVSKSHKLPCDYVAAFCRATENYELLTIQAEAAGMFILPGSEALRAEVQRFDEQVRKAQIEKKRRLLLLQEIEKGQDRGGGF